MRIGRDWSRWYSRLRQADDRAGPTCARRRLRPSICCAPVVPCVICPAISFYRAQRSTTLSASFSVKGNLEELLMALCEQWGREASSTAPSSTASRRRQRKRGAKAGGGRPSGLRRRQEEGEESQAPIAALDHIGANSGSRGPRKPRLKLGLVEEARYQPSAHEKLTARQLSNLCNRRSARCPSDARFAVSLQGSRNLLPVARPQIAASRAISVRVQSVANQKKLRIR